MKTILRNTAFAIAAVILVAVGIWYLVPRLAQAPFCFNFTRDMQFGDRKVAHPVNSGFGGPGGILYYTPEVPALQMALAKQGFYIDPYESTGGKVYVAAFYGPSTRTAVMGFQKKYGLAQTGEVNDDTLDKLAALYSCPKSTGATSTLPQVKTVLSTTTPKR